MAILHKTDGTSLLVHPANIEKGFTLDELYALVGEPIEAFYLEDGLVLVFNEEGKMPTKTLPRNENATKIFLQGPRLPGDYIAGDALVLTRKEFR